MFIVGFLISITSLSRNFCKYGSAKLSSALLFQFLGMSCSAFEDELGSDSGAIQYLPFHFFVSFLVSTKQELEG